MGRLTDVVKNLLIINVIVFVGTMGLPDDVRVLGAMWSPLSDNFKPYQIITRVFMHSGFQHLLFNMLGLYFLGPMVEMVLGAKRFLMLYFFCAFGAVVLNVAVDYGVYYYYSASLDSQIISSYFEGTLLQSQVNGDQIMLLRKIGSVVNKFSWGASGAIFGVTAAFATLFPNEKLMLLFPPIPIKAKYLAIGFIVIALISGVSGANSGIGHWAHIGGAIVGFIMIKFVWKMQSIR